MICRAASSYEGPDGKPTAKGIGQVTFVMSQDVVAACWQAEMGRHPKGSSSAAVAATLAAAGSPRRWRLQYQGRSKGIAILSYPRQLSSP
jgi:hypothetical protein